MTCNGIHYMVNTEEKITLRKAAWIAGFGYLLMFGAPVSEFLVFPRLVDLGNGETTINHIRANLSLFRYDILLYLVNFIGDLIAAWAIYILLKPVNDLLSMFTAWLRIVYTILSLFVLMNMLTVLQLLQPHDYLGAFTRGQLQAQVMIALHSFREGWSFCYLFFGIYLILLGYLVFISGYISRIIGICLIIAGLGWFADNIQPYLFPDWPIHIGMIAGLGELVFMLWLFIGGTRLKEQG